VSRWFFEVARLLGLTLCVGVVATLLNGGTPPEFENIAFGVLAMEIVSLRLKDRS
jgi:hypothetical protein